MRKLLQAAALSVTSLLAATVKAEPPPGSDGRYAAYFHALHTPPTAPGYCCNVSDCRQVQALFREGAWYALVTKETYGDDSGAPDDWVRVPPETYVEPDDFHPRPQVAVLCWYQKQLRCFAEPLTGG